MIKANLTLTEKIRYAAIGEYSLTPDDMQEQQDDYDNQAWHRGWEEGKNDAEREARDAMYSIDDDLRDLIRDIENNDLTSKEIIERLEEIRESTI